MLSRDLISRPTVRWISLAALGLAAGTAAVTLWLHRPQEALPFGRPTRTAIRVTCDRPYLCETLQEFALDVWSEHHGPGQPIDIVVPRSWLRQITELGLAWQVIDPDIDATADAEAARLRSPAANTADWFAEYRDYEAIAAHLGELADAAPERAALQVVGNSLENRPLWALRIGGSAPDAVPMLIDGTLHAREWIAAMTATCIADRLVRDYDKDPAIRAFVDHTRLFVVPVVNPDGYQVTWAGQRFWRKNRRDRHGVDLNRNFSVGFGGTGSSGVPSSETYRGPRAFSEPESSALRDLAKRERIALHIDFHAYGQIVLYPWGFKGTPPADRDRLAAVGDRITSAAVAAHGTPFKLSSGVEFYPAAGILTDWMYGEAGALSYTIELRPRWPAGSGGFVLPPEQIRPTCDEGLAAVLALRAAH